MAKEGSESEKYSEMMREVEEITASLEAGGVDLDSLVAKIERGYGLIEKMKARLDDTEAKVTEISARFKGGEAD